MSEPQADRLPTEQLRMIFRRLEHLEQQVAERRQRGATTDYACLEYAGVIWLLHRAGIPFEAKPLESVGKTWRGRDGRERWERNRRNQQWAEAAPCEVESPPHDDLARRAAMYYRQGVSVDQIGQLLGEPEAAVVAALRRAGYELT